MNDLQKTITFWILLSVIIAGNLMLLYALKEHLFVAPSNEGNWLLTVFATEILGSFVFAWKYFFRDPETNNDKSTTNRSAQSNSPISDSLLEQITLSGLIKLIPSRKYYPQYDSTISNMLNEADHSFSMISVNLMTGLPFEGLLLRFKDKLRSNDEFFITISLINPQDDGLVYQFSKLLDISSDEFSSSVSRTLNKLIEFREHDLNDDEKNRFNIRVHNSIPFASAIIRDVNSDKGRIQLETKIYKEPINSSFALEFIYGSESGMYQTLVSGYTQLMKDGEEVSAVNR